MKVYVLIAEPLVMLPDDKSQVIGVIQSPDLLLPFLQEKFPKSKEITSSGGRSCRVRITDEDDYCTEKRIHVREFDLFVGG